MIEKLGLRMEDRPRIYASVFEGAELGSLNYWLEIVFSCGIATLGLVQSSPAVVIGAMLISPLMGPIVAAGLALAAADLYLGIKALVQLAASIVLSVLFSATLVWLLPFHTPTSEILARTQPNLLDLGVAIFSGLAGSLLVARGAAGAAASALPGVAIAVALMPPLCTVGFGFGAGFLRSVISGAAILFLTNLAAIIASSFVVFLVLRMQAPEVRQSISSSILESGRDEWLFQRLRPTALGSAFGRIGQLRFRAAMLVVVLGLVAVPLYRGFEQVRQEAVTRTAVTRVLRTLVRPGALVSREIELLPDHTTVRVLTTAAVDAAAVTLAEKEIARVTGKDARLRVQRIAAEEDLAVLRDRLAAPVAVPAPAPPSLDQVRAEWASKVESLMRELWPKDAALSKVELSLASDGVVVRARYKGAVPLRRETAEVIRNVLRQRLSEPALEVELVRE